MTKTPSLKNVSTADLENALATAIANLTGWPEVRVNVEQTAYTTQHGECAHITLQAHMRTETDDGLPF